MKLFKVFKFCLLGGDIKDKNDVNINHIIDSCLKHFENSIGTNFLICLNIGIMVQSGLLSMQSNQSVSLSGLVAMALHFYIQNCVTYMVSEDILMVLFYNCSTNLVSYGAQSLHKSRSVGMTGITDMVHIEEGGILNLTAFDCLASSIL